MLEPAYSRRKLKGNHCREAHISFSVMKLTRNNVNVDFERTLNSFANELNTRPVIEGHEKYYAHRQIEDE